jgi:hypothetical protein
MSWLDNYVRETDQEIASFISYSDARKAARAQLAAHKAQIAAEQQAEEPEEEEDLEEPVEKPVGIKESEQIPEQVQRFLQSQRRMEVMGGPSASPQQQKYSFDPNMKLDPSKALDAIFGNEGGKTGQQTQLRGKDGRRASALGRYQIVDSTREGIRQGHFSKFSRQEFERLYKTNPEFERAVARAHMSDLIKRYGENALGAWYSPKYVTEKRWNEVPSPEYGNKLTIGQYQRNAMNRYRKMEIGGEIFEEAERDKPISPKSAVKKSVKKKADTDKFEMRYKKVDSTFPDIVRGILPLPDNAAQMVTKFLFNNAAMSESSLDDEQKMILWDTIQNAKRRSGKNNGGTEYQDYGNQGFGSPDEYNQWFNKGSMNGVDVVKNSLTNPGYKLASTIGRGRYWTDPEDEDILYYTDVYDWNTKEKNFEGDSWYQKLRNKMRDGEEKNLNAEKNEPNRMNFKLNRKEIEAIRAKKKPAALDTSSKITYYLPPDTLKKKQHGGWLDKYANEDKASELHIDPPAKSSTHVAKKIIPGFKINPHVVKAIEADKMNLGKALRNKFQGKNLSESQRYLDKLDEKITGVAALYPNPLISLPSAALNMIMGVMNNEQIEDSGLDLMGVFGTGSSSTVKKLAKRAPFFKGLTALDTVGDILEFTPSKDLPKKQTGGWLDKFDKGGEVEPEPKSTAPKGYARRTKEQREAWNSLLDYAAEKGLAGKPELDDRNQNLSRGLIDEFNTKFPDRAISPDEVQHYQYELRGINEGSFPQLVTSKPEYAQIWGERMYKDKFNDKYINKERSQADNWFGSMTSTQYYPQYQHVDKNKKIDYGVDYDRYAEAIYQENQKLKTLAKNKRGGKIRIK